MMKVESEASDNHSVSREKRTKKSSLMRFSWLVLSCRRYLWEEKVFLAARATGKIFYRKRISPQHFRRIFYAKLDEGHERWLRSFSSHQHLHYSPQSLVSEPRFYVSCRRLCCCLRVSSLRLTSTNHGELWVKTKLEFFGVFCAR